MIEIQANVRNWGNSLGITFPSEIVNTLNVKAGEKVRLLVLKDNNVLKETFGTLKFKKSTKAMMEESDKELYDSS